MKLQLGATFAALLLWATTSVAQTHIHKFEVDIQGDSTTLPSTVCLVSEIPGSKDAPGVVLPLSRVAATKPPPGSESTGAKPCWIFDDNGKSVSLSTDCLGSSLGQTKEVPQAAELALRALVERPSTGHASGRRACAPNIELPAHGKLGDAAARGIDRSSPVDARYIACSRNALPGIPPRRVLVVHAVFRNMTKHSLEAVDLYGGTLTVYVRSPRQAESSMLSASVLGGWYVRTGSTRSSSEAGKITLAPHPRCTSLDVQLPWTPANETVVATLLENGKTLSRTTLVGASGQLLWPNVDLTSDVSSRVVEVCATTSESETTSCDSQSDAVRLEGRAKAPGSSDTTRLNFRRMVFAWRRSRLLPRRLGCPDVKLPEYDIDCKEHPAGESNDLCTILCDSTRPFSLPTTARFVSMDGEASWEERLVAPRQVLTGYDDRPLITVDFSDWWRGVTPPSSTAAVRGDRIHYVEIQGPSGTTHRVRIVEKPAPRVHVPGAGEGDIVLARVLGAREYRRTMVTVRNGTIRLPSPARTAHQWEVLAGGGGGFLMQPSFGKLNLPQSPYGLVGLGFRHLPVHKPFYFEWRASYVLTAQPYAALDPFGPSDENDVRRAAVNRFYLEAWGFLRVADPVDFGAGGGCRVQYALRHEDQDRIGGTHGSPDIGAVARFKPWRTVALDLTGRLGYNSVIEWDEGGLRGEPTREEHVVPDVLVGGGIWFTL